MQLMGQSVVVGYDGSRAARAAVVHAAARVGDHGRVFVVYAYAMPSGWLGNPYFNRRLGDARRQGAAVLEQLLTERRSALPVTDYVDELLAGSPADTINNVAKARNARAIMIGYAGRRHMRAIFGRVSHRLLRIADRPVLIVPEPTTSPKSATEPLARHGRDPDAKAPAGWPGAAYPEPPWS